MRGKERRVQGWGGYENKEEIGRVFKQIESGVETKRERERERTRLIEKDRERWKDGEKE